MRQPVVVVGALLGLLGVAAGAFGAHGLRTHVSARDLEIWRTGAHYQQLHAVLLVVLGFWATGSRTAKAAVILTTLGVIVFSGTLYAMVLGAPRMLGAITPIGGLCLMGGWLAVALHALGRGRDRTPTQSDASG